MSEEQQQQQASEELTDCVDAHFHVWDLQKFSYSWPTAQDPVLFRNFTVQQLQAAMSTTPVRHGVFVQVLNHSPQEASWMSELADTHDVIKGIVAGIDVTDPNLDSILDSLDSLSSQKKVVGIRHILDFEREDWLARSDVISGLRVLEKRGIPFDLLLRPHLLKYVPRLSEELPKLRMVVDHLAKPLIKEGEEHMQAWADHMTAIAANPNIFCKLSGMVTEADLKNWKEEHFEPYVKHVLACFGPERCMFGSDWPVCTLAHASYTDVFCLLQRLVARLAPGQERAIFRDNAVAFYNLKL